VKVPAFTDMRSRFNLKTIIRVAKRTAQSASPFIVKPLETSPNKTIKIFLA